MRLIKQWVFVRALLCLIPFIRVEASFAEEQAMSRQQQCEEYGVYQNGSENWVDCIEEAYTEDTSSNAEYVEEPYIEEPYVEEVYIEEPYQEEPYQEDSYIDEPYVEHVETD